ncbi:HAD domain-containing protein [Variovorax sp. N23]|uniref:HAD domain-containing protein n=1 Tax=Variovorax sp. N23 TaxID=2980555 RepID=UPI0021C74676|nr:HAD domain-containing protein [Variovorax sp. N23]MCU4120365.1 HAD domain-containing protein [Variovorax sp. N23]
MDIDDVLCLNAPYGGYDAAAALAAERPTKRSAAVATSANIWDSLFEAAACGHLRRINDEFCPLYVLTTSWWQALGEKRLREALARGGLQWVVDSLHPDAATPKIRGRTNRRAEIQAWLAAHPEFANRFVVIDDELSGTGLDLELQSEHGPFIVLCKESRGLREAEYLRLRAACLLRMEAGVA